MKNYLTKTALMTSLFIAGSVTLSAAQNNAAAILFGAILDEAIESNANQNAHVQAINNAATAQRQENRHVQNALNYFDFDAGVPDGIFGRKTRSAVSAFQVFLDFPVTGELRGSEKDFLLGSYERARAGGAITNNTIVSDPNGSRALLLGYRAAPIGSRNSFDDNKLTNSLGSPANDLGANDFGANETQNANNAAPAQIGALPMFIITPIEPSMETLCLNGQNGLQSEFCDLRDFAINEGNRLAMAAQAVSAAEISAQCLGFAPVMLSYRQSAGGKPSFELLDDLHEWARNVGGDPAALTGVAKVCLGVGYASDDADVALASVLALIGLDQPGYSELLGYHLALGVGFIGNRNKTRGAEWLDTASLAFTSGDAGINGQSGASRAIIVSALAGQLRGAAAPTAPLDGVDNGGFFSAPASE